jgi:hypothetical protein
MNDISLFTLKRDHLPPPKKRVLHAALAGYGAMQLAGPGIWAPPHNRDGAVRVLRAAIGSGIFLSAP